MYTHEHVYIHIFSLGPNTPSLHSNHSLSKICSKGWVRKYPNLGLQTGCIVWYDMIEHNIMYYTILCYTTYYTILCVY